MYYRNANCAVVVYDITQTASLEKARSWIRELQRQADPSITIALCGNKLDLEARRQVTQEEAQKYAEEEGLMWSETSAKSGEGVSDIFTALGTCSGSLCINKHRSKSQPIEQQRNSLQAHLLQALAVERLEDQEQ
jgi:Ras-related protein Rab-5C